MKKFEPFVGIEDGGPGVSKEDDLTWLARNVHEWVTNELLRMKPCDNGNGTLRASWCYSGDGGFTKDQWLARRAELQNRPSWEDAPEWAEWLGQDNEGDWFWESHKPDPKDGFWNSLVGSKSASAGVGLPLGDWRDTLERRPELTAEDQCVLAAQDMLTIRRAAHMHKSEPEIDTSAEHVQKSAESIHDWYERGDLPPAGIECEARTKGDKWVRVWTVGIDSDGAMVVQFTDEGIPYHGCEDASRFRPLRTDRAHLLDLINGGLLAAVEPDKIADAILAAGFTRGGKE